MLSSCPADYLRGGAAFGLIALMLGTEVFRRALGHGVFVWLGRVSYSLYLVHVPIIYIVMQTIGEVEPIIATVAVVIPTLLAAELLARMVELPFISLGKRVASAL